MDNLCACLFTYLLLNALELFYEFIHSLTVTAANRSHSGVYMCIVAIAGAGNVDEKYSNNVTVTVIICKLTSSQQKYVLNFLLYLI